jgi:NAD(P)H-dependent FMN reductase
MPTSPIKLALIYGSAREGRFCDRVAGWVLQEVKANGAFAVDVIDPADPATPDEIRARIDDAEAFIVVTPEYNHSYPAPLKALIDGASTEWHAKPVAFVSYGGVSGGLRAVEHLRTVFAELHAVTIRDTLSFIEAWEQFDGRGRLSEPDRARRTMAKLLARLRWWADSLREARAASPYDEAA